MAFRAREDVYLIDVERDATNLYLIHGDEEECETATALTSWLRCRHIQAIYYSEGAGCRTVGMALAANIEAVAEPSGCRLEDLLARHPGESIAVVDGHRAVEEFLDLVCERLPVRRLSFPAPAPVAVVRIGQGRHALLPAAEDAISA